MPTAQAMIMHSGGQLGFYLFIERYVQTALTMDRRVVNELPNSVLSQFSATRCCVSGCEASGCRAAPDRFAGRPKGVTISGADEGSPSDLTRRFPARLSRAGAFCLPG